MRENKRERNGMRNGIRRYQIGWGEGKGANRAISGKKRREAWPLSYKILTCHCSDHARWAPDLRPSKSGPWAAVLLLRCPPQKRWSMACINSIISIFTVLPAHPHINPQTVWTMPLQKQVPHFTDPKWMELRSRPSWLVSYLLCHVMTRYKAKVAWHKQ